MHIKEQVKGEFSTFRSIDSDLERISVRKNGVDSKINVLIFILLLIKRNGKSCKHLEIPGTILLY
jgi:hypothetical protein